MIYRASGEPYRDPPRGVEQRGLLRGLSPRPPARARALLRVVPAAPRPPGLRPLCALRRTGPGYLSINEKGRCGLSTPVGCGQRSRASIGRDPPPHGFFIKRRRRPGQPECGQAAGLSTVGRQCRAWVTHEPAGLSTPLWCGQVSYPCGDQA